MKKDIYIIKNKVNDKCYIGQSNDPEVRWRNHKQRAREGQRQHPLYRAIRELGVDQFYYTVLEKGPDNPDEREIFWINFFRSRVPNGYNVEADLKHNAALKDIEIVNEVKRMIRETGIPFKEIAKKYGMAAHVIYHINSGHSYFDPSAEYPLRLKDCKSHQVIKQVHYALKYETEKSIKMIASEYDIPLKTLNRINQGEIYRLPGNEYPLRDTARQRILSKEEMEQIADCLMNDTLSFEEIAKQYNTSASMVQRINEGKELYLSSRSYPLREASQDGTNQRHCLSPDELHRIEEKLKNTDESIHQIAFEFNLADCTVREINRGRVKKYRRDDVKYPLRDKQ